MVDGLRESVWWEGDEAVFQARLLEVTAAAEAERAADAVEVPCAPSEAGPRSYFQGLVPGPLGVELLSLRQRSVHIGCGGCPRIIDDLRLSIRDTSSEVRARLVELVGGAGNSRPNVKIEIIRDGGSTNCLWQWTCKCSNRPTPRVYQRPSLWLLSEFVRLAEATGPTRKLVLTHEVRTRPSTRAASRSRSGSAWA